MKIICLFGQRIESYDGEYAPELLAAIDEYSDDENPDFMNDEEDKYNNDYDDFSFIKRIIININDKEFNEVFFGKEINGTIKKEIS